MRYKLCCSMWTRGAKGYSTLEYEKRLERAVCIRDWSQAISEAPEPERWWHSCCWFCRLADTLFFSVVLGLSWIALGRAYEILLGLCR